MNIKRRFLSTIIATVLAVIALTIAIYLSASIKDPTSYLVDYLKDYTQIDDVDISFSSIDKDLSKLTLKDINISYLDKNIISSDSIKFEQDLISIIKTVLFKSGTFKLYLNNLEINLDEELIKTFTTKTESTEEKTGSDYKFNIIAITDNAKLSVNPYTDLEFDLKVKVEDLKNIKFLNLDIDKEFKVNYQDHEVILSNLELAVDKNAKINSTNIKYHKDDIDISLDQLNLVLDSFLDYKNNIHASFDLLTLNYLTYLVSLDETKVSYINSLASGNIKNINLDSKYLFNTNNVDFEVKYNDKKDISSFINFNDNINASYDIYDILSSSFDLNLSYNENINVKSTIPNIIVNSEDNKIANLNNTSILFNNNTNNNVELSSSIVLDNINEFINSSSFNISSAISFDKELKDSNVKISNIKLPHIPEEININANYSDKYLINLDYNNELILDATYDDELDLTLDFNKFNLYNVKYYFDEYAALVTSFISKDSELDGKINLKSKDLKNYNLTNDILIDELKFRNYNFDLNNQSKMKLENKELIIDNFNLYSDLFKLELSGILNNEQIVKSSNLSLTVQDKQLVELNTLYNDLGYEVKLLSPILENLSFDTFFKFDNSAGISTKATISKTNFKYPVDFYINLEEKLLKLTSDNLNVYGEYGSNILLNTSFNNFNIPISSINLLLDGEIKHIVNYESQNYSLTSPRFKINNTDFIIDFNEKLLSLNDFNLNLNDKLFKGQVKYKPENKNFALTLANGEESLDMSVINNDSNYSGIININEINLDIFNIENTKLDTILLAKADSIENLLFTGNVKTHAIDNEKAALLVNSDINLSYKELLLSNMVYKNNDLSLLIDEIYYSNDKDYLTSNLVLDSITKNNFTQYETSLDLSLDIKILKDSNVFTSIYNTYKNMSSSFNSTITINDLNIDNKYIIKDKKLEIDSNQDEILFTGDFLNGKYLFNNYDINLALDLNPIISFNIDGNLDLNNLNLNINDLIANASVYQAFNASTAYMLRDNNIIKGNILVSGNINDVELYGEINADNLEIESRFLQHDFIQIPDVKYSIFDNTVTSNATPAILVNKKGDRKNLVSLISQKLKLSTSNFVEYFDIDLEFLKDNSPLVTIPLKNQNIGIEAHPYGIFNIFLINGETFMSGDLTLVDSVISYGIGPIPSWWPKPDPKGKQRLDVNLTIEDNVKVILPYSADPIISAYIKNGTKFSIYTSKNPAAFEVNGNIELDRGEVFYFNKRFYIDEGNFKFTQASALPFIDLKANIKDFDSDGNKFTISLLLQNASFDNINPKFVSSPSKSQEEIMYILGNSLMPPSTTGEYSFSSFASILTSGYTAIRSFNKDSGLSLTTLLQNNLNLDMLSIRTNLFENLIFDGLNYSTSNLTPLSRYLNNTAMYIGKYLNPDMFLQGMFKLVAQKDSFSLIDKDINIVTEINLDWLTPLADFSVFIKPTGTNVDNILDTFGFSIVKTFNF